MNVAGSLSRQQHMRVRGRDGLSVAAADAPGCQQQAEFAEVQPNVVVAHDLPDNVLGSHPTAHALASCTQDSVTNPGIDLIRRSTNIPGYISSALHSDVDRVETLFR